MSNYTQNDGNSTSINFDALDKMAPLNVALFWASKGYPIFPCREKDDAFGNVKTPLTKSGFKDATTDLQKIKEWWTKYPTALIGYAVPENKLIIDVDPRNGGDINDVITRFGQLPNTPTVLTPSGGQHYYFTTDTPLRNTASKLAPGIDTRGTGGYVILPGSALADGRRYTFEANAAPNNAPIAKLPPALVNVLYEAKPVTAPNKPLGVHTVIEGGRNDYLARKAGQLRRLGLNENLILEAIIAENEAVCSPPLDIEELRTIARSIARYEPAPINIPATAQQDFGVVDPETGEILVKDGVNPWANRIYNQTEKLTPPNWVIDGFLADGLTIIAGAPGIGKTSALVPLAAMAAGFISHLCHINIKTRRKVIYVTEDAAQVNRILFGMRKHLKRNSVPETISFEEMNDWFTIIETHRSTPTELALLAHYCKNKTNSIETAKGLLEVPPLVILDTASATLALTSENDNSEVAKYVSCIKETFLRMGMVVWLIAHTPKALDRQEVQKMTARGASAFEGDANCTAYLFQDKDVDQRILQLGKRRYEPAFTEMAFDGTVHYEITADMYGDMVEIPYRFTIPAKSDEAVRKAMGAEKRDEVNEELRQKRREHILEIVATAEQNNEYITKRSLRDKVGGMASIFESVINAMIDDGEVLIKDLPGHMKHGAKKHYLGLPNERTNGTHFEAA